MAVDPSPNLGASPSVAGTALTNTNDTLNHPSFRRSLIVAGQSAMPATVNVGGANLNNGVYWMGAS